jgi:hypothetical protein
VSHRVRRLASVAGVVAAAGILLGPSAEGARAPASSCGTGTLVATPNVGKFDLLRGIAAISPRDVWAVGIHLAGNSERALVEHWDGMRWRVAGVPQPATFHVDLNAVTAVSATDVWAVGGTVSRRGQSRTLIEHWDGSAWHIVPNSVRGALYGVAAGAAGNVWAVGHGSLTEHWDGTRWRVVPSPSPGRFAGFAAVSVAGPDSVWAVGTVLRSGNAVALAEHWNGSTWSPVPVPVLVPGGFSQLFGVTSAGSNDVWAVGMGPVQTHQGVAVRPLTERWNGSRWSVVPGPFSAAGGQLNGVAAVSARDVWAVGDAAGHELVARWNGRAWAVVAAPQRPHGRDSLSAVSASAATDVWAAGVDSRGGKSFRTLIEDVCPGTADRWSV